MSQDFREELVQQFREYSNDELLEKLKSGVLIELAQDVALHELKARGIEFSGQPVATMDGAEDTCFSPGDFETVATFATPTDAHILRAHLESEGVPAFVPDAHLGVVNPFLLSGTGSIRVQVPMSLIPDATKIIRAIREGKYSLDESGQIGEPRAEPEQSPLRQEEAFLAFAQDTAWIKIWRTRMGKAGIWAGFNPFAAVVGMTWFFYRKMYVLGLIVMVADWIAISVFGSMQWLILVRLPVGVLANIFYYKKAEKAVLRAQAVQLPKEGVISQLKRQGGISIPGALIAVVINFMAGILAVPLSELLH